MKRKKNKRNKSALKNSWKKNRSKTNKVEIQINDFDNEIASSEKEDSQNEGENKTIFNKTFKFDKKYMPTKDLIKKIE